VLVVIDEVAEGNWAAGGATISLEAIANAVGLAKDGPRFQWTRKYFQAKARSYALAGYPTDVGGLLPSLGLAGTAQSRGEPALCLPTHSTGGTNGSA